MRNIEAEILGLLEAGPVRRRHLIYGKSARFLAAYQDMVKAHKIEEHTYPGLLLQPVYVCLPEQQPPAPKITRPRRYDVRLLMNAGYSRDAAIRAIVENDFETVLRLLRSAEVKCGLQTARGRGRPRKIVMRMEEVSQ
jgi:hypothetical protein